MDTTVDERYFTWLYSKIGSVTSRNKNRTHWLLAAQMHQKEFIWLVPNDDNRVEDGRYLRHHFMTESGITGVDPEWFDTGCSMLEMLVALSERLAFETDGKAKDWFWHLVDQLNLEHFSDAVYDEEAERAVNEALDRVIWRTYEPNGKGGLFPLNNPSRDQREVEIWYQLSAYLLELPS